MYKEISLNTQEGVKPFRFLATGTTAYRYRQVFHQDLMVMLNNMESADKHHTEQHSFGSNQCLEFDKECS